MSSEIALITGFFLGMVGSLVVNYLFGLRQYGASLARKRVDQITQATREFLLPDKETSELRDIYRFAMGVIIDDITNPDNRQSIDSFARWHFVCGDLNKDRWEKFNKHIRPIIELLHTYEYLSVFRWVGSRRAEQLFVLSSFLNQFEDVVAHLDACMDISDENNKERVQNYLAQKCTGANDKPLPLPLENEPIGLRELHKEMKRLFDLWQCWIRLCERRPDQWREDFTECAE